MSPPGLLLAKASRGSSRGTSNDSSVPTNTNNHQALSANGQTCFLVCIFLCLRLCIWHIHLFMTVSSVLLFTYPPPILDILVPSLSPSVLCLSGSSSCTQLSWQPCRCLQGPSTALCLSPTWQRARTRRPVARARKAGAAHRPNLRYVWASAFWRMACMHERCCLSIQVSCEMM